MRSRTAWWLVLAAVWIVAALYQWHVLGHGWLPHDEGTLAQSAERVLQGQLPHRDFDEVWTGALTFLNAAALRAFGMNLLSLRYPLYLVFLLWVPALFYIATRFAGPAAAGAVTALGAAWSLPQYSAAVPSWYNLFFATFATAALLRAIETGHHRWVFAAGVAIGLSLTFKIVALYCVAAVLLFLVYREAHRSGVYRAVIGAGLMAFVAALFWLVHRRLAVGEVLHFVVPGAALAGLVYHECRRSDTPGGGWARLGALSRSVAIFAAGLAVPLGLFLGFLAHVGATGGLWTDVFVAPVRRFDLAARSLPGAATNLAALPVAMLVGMLPLSRLPRFGRRIALGILMAALIAFLVLSRHPVWYSIRPLVPLTVLVGIWLLLRRRDALSPLQRQRLVLLLAMTALWSLVQFPFAWPLYFFYVAPLAAPAVLAVLEAQGRRPGWLAAAVLALFLVVALVKTHPSRVPATRLALERGGLVVGARDAARYESLVALLRAHATGGYTYAAPDCPEVYFLTGLGNPTRTLWEFLSDTTAQTARVLRALEEHHVTAIAINRLPPFSGPLPQDLLDSLAARYPAQDSLDLFTVRWHP